MWNPLFIIFIVLVPSFKGSHVTLPSPPLSLNKQLGLFQQLYQIPSHLSSNLTSLYVSNTAKQVYSSTFKQRHLMSTSDSMRAHLMAAYAYAASCFDQSALTEWNCGVYCDMTPETEPLGVFHNLHFSISGYFAANHVKREILVVFRPAQHKINWITNYRFWRTHFGLSNDDTVGWYPKDPLPSNSTQGWHDLPGAANPPPPSTLKQAPVHPHGWYPRDPPSDSNEASQERPVGWYPRDPPFDSNELPPGWYPRDPQYPPPLPSNHDSKGHPAGWYPRDSDEGARGEYIYNDMRNQCLHHDAPVEYPYAVKKGYSGATIHIGFLENWNTVSSLVMQEIGRFMKEYQGYKLISTGYSMGAAFAIFPAIEAAYLLGIPASQIEVFTFGQPRLGNQAFVDFVMSLGFPIHRFVRGHDHITRIPPRILGYRHFPHELWMVNNTHIIDCEDKANPGQQDSHCAMSAPLTFSESNHFEYFWKYNKNNCR